MLVRLLPGRHHISKKDGIEMGLSEQERVSGIMWAINVMLTTKRNFDQCPHIPCYDKESVSVLGTFIDQLWHSFIGKQTNNAHWFIGSSSSSTITWDTRTVWGEAINYHCHNLLEKEDEDRSKDTFDAFDYFLDTGGLLSKERRTYQFVYEIFAWSEQLSYYLRRYEDEFLTSHEALSSFISKIQGECYGIFIKDEIFARAYLVNQILSKYVYGPNYPHYTEKDPVLKWIVENNIHHNVSQVMKRDSRLSLKDIAVIHKKLCDQKDKVSAFERLKIVFLFSGRVLYFDHIFQRLLEMIQSNKICSTKEVSELKKLFGDCKKQREEYEKICDESYHGSNNPTSIY